MRPYLDHYLRGSNGYTAEERVKLMKLLWDASATEFGGRHELYEINYGGSTEEIRRYCLFGAQASGNAEQIQGLRRAVHGGIRPQRLARSRSGGPRRTELPFPACETASEGPARPI